MTPRPSAPCIRPATRTSRLAAYVIPEVYEPPSDDVLEPEGSSPGPAAVDTPPVRSKRSGSTGTPKTVKQRRVRESTSAATLAGEPRTQWDVSEDHSPPAAVPRPTPKSVVYELLRTRPVGSGGGEDLFRYATIEQPRLVRPEGCCDSYVYLCEEYGL